MSTTSTDRQNCAVCGRGILKGEMTYDYATPAGEVRGVCSLCRPAAERVGWLPPGKLESVTQARRERRRGWLPSLLARRTPTEPAATQRASEGGHARRDRSQRPAAPTTAPAPVPVPEQARASAADPIVAALATFNAGSTPRLIAGLNKSLGEAKAEVKPSDDGEGALVTVAWELSWYAWEVSGLEVREVAKGAEVSEREGPEPVWNARIESDGRLTLVDRG